MNIECSNKEKQTSFLLETQSIQIDDNDSYGLLLLFSEDENKDSQSPTPLTHRVIQNNNLKNTSRTPDKNNLIVQKTKSSNWTIINSSSLLVISGIALKVL